MAGYLQPIDPTEDVFDGVAGLGEQRSFLDQACDDALDQGDLRVFESLEAPAIEFNAEDLVVGRQAHVDHFENAGFTRTPIAVNTYRDRTVRTLPEEFNDSGRDGLIVEEIDPCLVVSEYHRKRPRQI